MRRYSVPLTVLLRAKLFVAKLLMWLLVMKLAQKDSTRLSPSWKLIVAYEFWIVA